MCGIFGFTGTSPSTSVIKEIAAKLACRGPDRQAYDATASTGVICARLALWNEGNCDQPYTTGHQSTVFNGELFNLEELRSRLRLPGASEVQTFMVGWRGKGADFLRSIDGQFASIMVDHETGALKAVRDDWGICPLYYSVSGSSIVIGSSVESILALRRATVDDLDQPGCWKSLPGGASRGIERAGVTLISCAPVRSSCSAPKLGCASRTPYADPECHSLPSGRVETGRRSRNSGQRSAPL